MPHYTTEVTNMPWAWDKEIKSNTGQALYLLSAFHIIITEFKNYHLSLYIMIPYWGVFMYELSKRLCSPRVLVVQWPRKGRRGTCSIQDGGSDGASYCKPKKNTWAWNFTPLKIPGIKIFYPKKKTRLSTSILIYSIKQTLRPQQIRDISLDPKQIPSVNFQPQNIHRPPRQVYCKYPPPPPTGLSG